MKTIIIAAFLVLAAAARIEATSQNFNIFFFEGLEPGGPLAGSGTYTVDGGNLTAFHAIITECFNATVECNFNGTSGADPFDGIPSQTDFINFFSPPRNGGSFSVLNLFETSGPFFPPHQFTTHTVGSFDPSGTYFAVPTPQPSAFWLLLIGSLVIAWKRSHRSAHTSGSPRN